MSTSPSGTPSWLKWLIQNTSVPGITILIAVIVYQKTGNFSYVVYVLIGGAIIFGLLALFKDFMGSVWEELKKKWSLPVADWIHNKVTNIVSPYRKNICSILYTVIEILMLKD